MRYLLTPDDTHSDRPLDYDTFEECMTLLRMQMRRHNDEYYREQPPKLKALVYLY